MKVTIPVQLLTPHLYLTSRQTCNELTLFFLFRWRAASGLVAGLLSNGDGCDDAGLTPQSPLFVLLLHVL